MSLSTRQKIYEQWSTTELYGLMNVALQLALQEGTCRAAARHRCKASNESLSGCTERKNGRGWPSSPALQSLPSGKLDVLRNRQTMPLEVVEDRRRVPHRMAVPVRPDLTASRKRIVRVPGIRFQSFCVRPAIRPAHDVLQLPP